MRGHVASPTLEEMGKGFLFSRPSSGPLPEGPRGCECQPGEARRGDSGDRTQRQRPDPLLASWVLQLGMNCVRGEKFGPIEATEGESRIEAQFPEQVICHRGTRAVLPREDLSEHTVQHAGAGVSP